MRHVMTLGEIELPEGWEDHSTYQFHSPPLEQLAAPLARGAGASVAPPRMSIVMKRTELGAPNLETAVRLQREQMAKLLPGFRLLAESPWHHPQLGPIYGFEYEFEAAPGVGVRQAQLFVPEGRASRAVLVTFSATPGSFEACRPTFAAALASFSPE